MNAGESREAPNYYARSWGLFKSNRVLFVPALAFGVANGVAVWASVRGMPSTDAGALAVKIVTALIFVAFAVLTSALTTGMGYAAYRTGHATLGDGFAAMTRAGTEGAVALFALFLLGGVAAFLAPFTVGFSLVVFFFLCIHVMPAAYYGGREGLIAVAESAEVAFMHPLETALPIVLLGWLAVIASIFAAVITLVSDLAAQILRFASFEVGLVYVTLVIIGQYLAIRVPTN